MACHIALERCVGFTYDSGADRSYEVVGNVPAVDKKKPLNELSPSPTRID